MNNRREFLGGFAAAAAIGATPFLLRGAESAAKALRVCVFADLHYSPGEFPNDSSAFLEQILARAETARCDLVIHLGDFVHDVGEAAARALIRRYNDFKIPSRHVLGNHDQEHSSWQTAVEAYRLSKGYGSFDQGGFRFICLDPNYYRETGGAFVHYEGRNYFNRPDGATLAWIPPEQMEWLGDVLESSPFPCVIASHQSLERWGGVQNGEAVHRLLQDANARHPGRVRLVMNGHDHVDYLRLWDGIPYWSVNSANYKWFGKTHACYPADYRASHRLAKHCLAWDRPLSAILTLHPDGRTEIEGAEAGWLYGVTPAQAKLPRVNDVGRMVAPRIQSVCFTLKQKGQ